jgi:membrane protease YdiL (CAAX protease family)
MGGDSGLGALGSFANALFLIISVYVYFVLLRQIAARRSDALGATARHFGLPEAAVALFLASLFVFTSLGAANAPRVNLRSRDLIATALLELGLVAFVAIFLKLRRFDLMDMTGIGRLTFRRAFLMGTVLLIVGYPLISMADWLTGRILGPSALSRQGIVDLFSGSQSIEQRVLVILLAVAVAPLAEEFIFRFFLYGVLRRYAGRVVGLVISALLFAAVHAHLPSFAPLFVLGACFTLAYEWTGSLLVSMTMHSIFNSLTLVALAFPNTFEQ